MGRSLEFVFDTVGSFVIKVLTSVLVIKEPSFREVFTVTQGVVNNKFTSR